MDKRKSICSQMSIGSDRVSVTMTVAGVDFVLASDRSDWENQREYERAECACVSQRELIEVNELFTTFRNNAANIKKRGLL